MVADSVDWALGRRKMGILITNRSITRRRFTTMVDNNLICSQCSSRFISDHRPRSHPMITLTLSFCPFFVRNGITIVRWNDLQEDSWDGSCPQAEEPPEDSEVGRQGVQEEPSWERVEEALPGLFPRQGHRPGEDVSPPSLPRPLAFRLPSLLAIILLLTLHGQWNAVIAEASRPSSPTRPSGSAPGCSWSRTARRSPPSCPTTAAWTTSRRTYGCRGWAGIFSPAGLSPKIGNLMALVVCRTKCWSPGSGGRGTPSAISPESGSRWSRSRGSLCWRSSRRRRRSRGPEGGLLQPASFAVSGQFCVLHWVGALAGPEAGGVVFLAKFFSWERSKSRLSRASSRSERTLGMKAERREKDWVLRIAHWEVRISFLLLLL